MLPHVQNYTEGVTYANVPYPKQMLAAMANIDESFPGSCGRCYEVRATDHAQQNMPSRAISLNPKYSASFTTMCNLLM